MKLTRDLSGKKVRRRSWSERFFLYLEWAADGMGAGFNQDGNPEIVNETPYDRKADDWEIFEERKKPSEVISEEIKKKSIEYGNIENIWHSTMFEDAMLKFLDEQADKGVFK